MADTDQGPFARALQDRLTDLRLRADLGEIVTSSQFHAALQRDGRFKLSDPRVRSACLRAGFGEWAG
jgi:hypothetical protein